MALLSVFPTLSALISIYSLIADRDEVQHELDSFASILPAEAIKLLADQMKFVDPRATGKARHRVSSQLIGWSAMSAPCRDRGQTAPSPRYHEELLIDA